MTVKNQHVVTHNDQWAVRGENTKRVTSIHETQQEAIVAAREIAINNHTELFIHNKEGIIRERNSYSNDPHPPQG